MKNVDVSNSESRSLGVKTSKLKIPKITFVDGEKNDSNKQVTKTLFKNGEKKNTQLKNFDVSNSEPGSSGIKKPWMTI